MRRLFPNLFVECKECHGHGDLPYNGFLLMICDKCNGMGSKLNKGAVAFYLVVGVLTTVLPFMIW